MKTDSNQLGNMSRALGYECIHSSVRRNEARSPVPSLLSARDSVVATCRLKLEDGRLLIVITSIEHKEAPVDPNYVRAHVQGIAIFLTPFHHATPLIHSYALTICNMNFLSFGVKWKRVPNLKCLCFYCRSDDGSTGLLNITDVDLKGGIAVPTWILRRMIPKESFEGFDLLCKACRDKKKWPSHLLVEHESSPIL